MGKSNNVIFYFFCVCIVMLFYKSMYLYYLWNVTDVYIVLLTFVVGAMLYITSGNINKRTRTYYWATIFFLSSSLYLSHRGNLFYYLLIIMNAGCVLFTLTLHEQRKCQLLKIITNTYSFLMAVSLLGYLLVIGGVNLPNFGRISFGEYSAYDYINYGIVLINSSTSDFFRFNSLFLEPGHVSMIAAFILYANDFDFRKIQLMPILLAIVFSLSLAGYVLAILGFALHLLSTNRRLRYSKLLIFATLGIVFFYYAFGLNSGDNILNRAILSRLQYDQEKGIVGNNRNTNVVDDYFDYAVGTGQIVVGLGSEEYSKLLRTENNFAGAGYKMYLLEKGIIGTVLIFLFYFFVAYTGPAKRKLMFMLVLYSLSFLQRAYPSWWAWILPFICCAVEKPLNNKYIVA